MRVRLPPSRQLCLVFSFDHSSLVVLSLPDILSLLHRQVRIISPEAYRIIAKSAQRYLRSDRVCAFLKAYLC
jgi:hypothetical protein